nr:SprT family zinc-dependent metalloprotease [uncultured Cellulosilyticum sp.]
MGDITKENIVVGDAVSCVIVKENRKTAAIRIDKNLKVVVKVPLFMKENEVKEFIHKYEGWINETLIRKKSVQEDNDWIRNKKIMYLGQEQLVDIQVRPYAKEVVILNEKGIKVITSGDEIAMRKAMEHFFRERGKKLFTELTQKYASIVGVQYNKITIRKQETRWGSCSQNGNLSYNVKLMCAPKEMIEYVILHEVMHLRHFNHSVAFWKDIEELMPDYKKRMNYFKQFGQNFII